MKGKEIGADGTPGSYDYSVKIDLALYNLSRDISESLSVKTRYPELMEQLLQTADTMRAKLGDSLNDLPQGSETREAGRVANPTIEAIPSKE
jgi:arylsulfatase